MNPRDKENVGDGNGLQIYPTTRTDWPLFCWRCATRSGAAGAGGRPAAGNDERADPPRFVGAPATCLAPLYAAEEFLRAEGFTDLRYIDVPGI